MNEKESKNRNQERKEQLYKVKHYHDSEGAKLMMKRANVGILPNSRSQHL